MNIDLILKQSASTRQQLSDARKDVLNARTQANKAQEDLRKARAQTNKAQEDIIRLQEEVRKAQNDAKKSKTAGKTMRKTCRKQNRTSEQGVQNRTSLGRRTADPVRNTEEPLPGKIIQRKIAGGAKNKDICG